MTAAPPTGIGVGAFDAPTFDPDDFDTSRLGLHTDVVDTERHRRSVRRFRDQGVGLPTFAQ